MKKPRLIAASAIAVVILFQIIYGFKILIPTNVSWLMTVKDDWGTHYLGWFFYRNEPWQFPLGHINRYYYPIGTNIGFTDSIPLMAILFKLFSPLLPADFQYFGIWLFLCHLLTAYFTIRLFRLFKVKDIYTFFAVLLVTANPVLVYRGMHPALCAQWILIASFYIYFLSANVISVRKILLYQYILFVTSTLIHPYLAFMVMGFTFFTALKICFIEKVIQKKQFYFYLCAILFSAFVIWYCVGMIDLSGKQDAGIVGGYGLYSLNLNSLFNPGDFSNFLPALKLESYRQFESYMYLGMGMFLVIAFLIFYYAVQLIKRKRNYRNISLRSDKSSLAPLLIWLILLTLFSLTQNISLNDKVIFKLPAPKILIQIGNIFRASARFFWAPYYFIFLFSIITFAKLKTNKIIIISILVPVVCIQLYDTKPLLTFRRLTYGAYVPPISGNWRKLMEHFDNICFYPPFESQRLTPMDYQYFCYIAAQLKKPINIGYVARSDSRSMQKYSDSLSAALEDGIVSRSSLYITTSPYLHQVSQLIQQDSIQISILDGYYYLFSNIDENKKLLRIANDLNAKDKNVMDSVKLELKNKTVFTEISPIAITDTKLINYWIQRLHTGTNHISIEGWGFIDSTQNNKGDSTFITLSSADRYYRSPASIQARPDVTSHFQKSYLDDAGFKMFAFFDSIPKGIYQLGIAIRDQRGRWIYQQDENMIHVGMPQYIVPEKITQLPVTGKIIFGFSPVEYDVSTLKINGWAALDQRNDDGSKISLILKNGDNIYACDPDPVLRPDVTTYFNNKYQLDHSGFKMELLKKSLDKGKYRIGIRIVNSKYHDDCMIFSDLVLDID